MNPSVIIKVLNIVQIAFAVFFAAAFFGGFADWKYMQYML